MISAIVISLLALASPAIAQTEDRNTEIAREIVNLVQNDSSFDEMMDSMVQFQIQIMQQRTGSANPEQIQGTMKKLSTVLKEDFSRTLKDDMVTAYASTFTAEELQGILDFYRSPIGKKLIEKTPQLTRKSMELQEKNFAKLWPKIEQAMKEYTRDSGSP
jgi:hypothetical protein